MRLGCRPDDSEDDQRFLGEEGVRKTVSRGVASAGDHPRRWRAAKVLEGQEGAGGGGAPKEDVGRRDGDSGKGRWKSASSCRNKSGTVLRRFLSQACRWLLKRILTSAIQYPHAFSFGVPMSKV